MVFVFKSDLLLLAKILIIIGKNLRSTPKGTCFLMPPPPPYLA